MTGRQFFLRLKYVVIVAISMGLFKLAVAVGLGPIQVDSYLGQPLRASIKVSGLSAAAAERTTVKLASVADYQSRGIEKLPSHDKLQFNIVKAGSGYLITVRSSAGIREPFVNFLLTMNSDGANVTREYAVFLNPDPAQAAGITSNPAPELMPEQTPVKPIQANASKPATITLSKPTNTQAQPIALATQQSQVASQAPKQIPPSAPMAQDPSSQSLSSQSSPSQPVTVTLQPASAATPGWGGGNLDGAVPVPLTASTNNVASEQDLSTTNQASSGYVGAYGPVKPGETLYSIALQTRPSDSVSVNKMMRAIYRANRRAFSSNNMSSLMAGYRLTIPDVNTIAATPATAPKPINSNAAKPASTSEPSTQDMLAADSQTNAETNEDLPAENVNETDEMQLEDASAQDALLADASEEIDDMQASAQTGVDAVAEVLTPAATAEIARANMTVDTQEVVAEASDALEQEVDEASTDIDNDQPMLSSELALDGADSLDMGEQAAMTAATPSDEASAMADDETSQASNAQMADEQLSDEQLADEQVQAETESESAIAESEEVIAEEAGADQTEAQMAATEAADSQEDSANSTTIASNEAATSKDEGMMLSKWMLALLVILAGLIAGLIFLFFKRRSAAEQDMSDEEMNAMLASLEEDDSLKQALEFDELTEDPTVNERIEDISDTYRPMDDLSSDQAFSDVNEVDDDFEKLAAEAAKLGKLDEDEPYSSQLTDNKPSSSTYREMDTLNLADEDLSENDNHEHSSQQPLTDDVFFDTVDEDTYQNVEQKTASTESSSFSESELPADSQATEPAEDDQLPEFDFTLNDETDGDKNQDGESTSSQSAANDRSKPSRARHTDQQPFLTNNELDEAMEINLDLANAFIVTGNGERAKVWLEEVLDQGNEEQKAKAQAMLDQINQA